MNVKTVMGVPVVDRVEEEKTLRRAMIRSQMNGVDSQIKSAQSSLNEYTALKSKVETLIGSLKKPVDNLLRAEKSLAEGGFLIDNNPIDNGKIIDVNKQISNLVNNADNVLAEVNQKINTLMSNISSLNSQYRSLQAQYNSI